MMAATCGRAVGRAAASSSSSSSPPLPSMMTLRRRHSFSTAAAGATASSPSITTAGAAVGVAATRKSAPPQARHRTARLPAWKQMQYRRVNYEKWPPEDASPFHPIEPWGKSFAVFNAFETIPFEQWTGPRGPNPLLPPKQSSDGQLLPTRTVLAVTDFAKRPSLFLSRADFDVLVRNLPELKRALRKNMEELEEPIVNRLFSARRLLLPRMSYGMQRTKTGEHSSHGMQKGTRRERKKGG